MSPQEHDDELLREYLEGDSALSRLYRRGASEQPDAQLDARIRASARDAVARQSRVAHSPFARHWMVPTSIAAVFVLSVSVVLLMQEPAIDPGFAIDEVSKTASDTTIVGDAPAGAADAEQQSAPASAPAPAQASRRREQASDGDDSAAGGRASGFASGALQRADEAEEKPGEKRKSQATQAESVSGGEVRSPQAPSARPAPDPRPLPAGTVRDDPRAWLRFIEMLLDDRNRDGAKSNLRAFRTRYPHFPLPATLVPLAASLDAEAP